MASLTSGRAWSVIFSDFDRWGYDEKGWSRRTRRDYFAWAALAHRWLTENRDTTLVRANLTDLKAFLFTRPPVAATRNHVRQALVGFGEYLLARGHVRRNEAKDLPRLPRPRSLPRARDSEAIRQVIAAANAYDPMTRLLALAFIYSGLRCSELRLLEWRHVEPGWLRFAGKGSKERAVPLHSELETAFGTWRFLSPDPRWVFPSTLHADRPISEGYLRVRLREVGNTAGIDHLAPHVLRHSFATELYEQSGDIRATQEVLGHASLLSTQVYTDVRPGRVKKAVRGLNLTRRSTPSEAPESQTVDATAT
jgi:site-specific recombinase XerC